MITDHKPLAWLLDHKSTKSSHHLRWALQISEYDLTVMPGEELVTMVRRARTWARDASTAWSTKGSAAPEQLQASATLVLGATGARHIAPSRTRST